MGDMANFIAPKSDQLTADDLLSEDRIVTITGVQMTPGEEKPCKVSYKGDGGKPWCPCKTMGRVMVKAWGPDSAKYAGKSVQLYRDPEVTWAGMKVGGVRIKALSHIDKPFDMALTETRGRKAVARFFPLKIEEQVDKVAEGVAELIERIRTADNADEIEGEAAVVKQRAWLVKNRPELAAQVDAAFDGTTSEGAE